MIRQFFRWMSRPPCFGGLVGALLFFALSFTPSLIPRDWHVQGILAGLTAAIGYSFGSAASALLRLAMSSEPSRTVKRRAWIGLLIATPIVLVASVFAGAYWDGQLRQLMEMPLEKPWERVALVVVAVVAAVVLVLIARVLRGLGRLVISLVNRILPRRAAIVVGGVAAAAFVVFVLLGGLAESLFQSIDKSAEIVDRTVQPDVAQPTSSLRSGSPESLIEWEDLGAKGREFTGKGPTVEQLSAFAGKPAMEPIRVYGGLRAADDLDALVDLVMQELERTGAFERSAIFVQTPSGNGEVPRVNLATPEYMLGGDVAQVAVQYGYAGSFTTMLTKPGAGNDAAAAIVTAVEQRVAEMPEAQRPAVFVAGESLGSLATESAFEDIDDLAERVDGALFVGPTLFNEIRNDLIADRDEGSPVWLPVIDDGAVVRFAREPANLSEPGAAWDGARVVYLQNSSDPVAWFATDMWWNPPAFLDDPRGPDVSNDMFWMPVVTFWQTLIDLPFASGAAEGHGHRYGLNIVDGWAAVIQPPDWTEDDTQRLRVELTEDK